MEINQSPQNKRSILFKIIKEAPIIDFGFDIAPKIQDIKALKVMKLTTKQIKVIRSSCINFTSLNLLCKINYKKLKEILKIQSLQILCLAAPNEFFHTFALKKSNNLKILEVHNRKIGKGQILNLTKRFPSLQNIMIGGSTIFQKSAIQALRLFLDLKCLRLYDLPPINKETVDAIVNHLGHISRLDFIKCTFSDKQALQGISELSNLRGFFLEQTNIRQCGLQDIFKKLPLLQEFSLYDYKISKNQIFIMSQSCPNIQFLQLIDANLSDCSFQIINISLKKLLHLNIESNPSITSLGVLSLSKKHPFLRTLIFNECLNINDSIAKIISQNLPQLQQLSLQGCCFTSKVLIYFRKIKSLRRLCLYENHLTSSIAQKLVISLPRLLNFHISSQMDEDKMLYENLVQIKIVSSVRETQ